MERTKGHQRMGSSVSGAKRNIRSNIPTPLRRTPVRNQAQPPSRDGSRAVQKNRQQNALKTGRGFQPQINETDDDAAETEPVASNVRNVRRLTYVKPVPEVRQSPRKLQAASKTSKENIPQKVGRRTGTAAFEGKNIRLLPDGTENFDDYWTDSEAEISSSRELVLNEKNSTFNKPSNIVISEISQSPKKSIETVRYSTAPKIGRRTGVSAFEGKKIRLLPDGTENFDDYFTDDSSSKDSYLTKPSHKKLGIPLKESSAITDAKDSDRAMIHKSCDTKDLAASKSSSNSKHLREHSVHGETSAQNYKDKHISLISPRRNLLAFVMETDLKSSLNANKGNKDFSRSNENEAQLKNASLSNTTKSKKKITVESINKTRSFKETENLGSGISHSKRLTKTFSHSKNNISFPSFRNRNVWIEDSLSEDDSNITQSKTVKSKTKVLYSAEASASDEADASHSVQPTTKVKNLKKRHDDISSNRLQQSIIHHENENSANKMASEADATKAPKVKKSTKKKQYILKRRRSRTSDYNGNYGDSSSSEDADAVVSPPKVRKSKKHDDVSIKGLTHDNRENISSQEFVVENIDNDLPSNKDDTNASQTQNDKSKRKKHKDISRGRSKRSIINSDRDDAGNFSAEDETDDASQAGKAKKSKRKKHGDITNKGPRHNIRVEVDNSAGNLFAEDAAESSLVPKETKLKQNKIGNVSTGNEGPSTRSIAEADALVSAEDEADALVSAEDEVEAVQVPKRTKLNKKKEAAISTDRQRLSIRNIDEMDNEADTFVPAPKVKKSKKKKQNNISSTERVRRGTRIRVPPLETWRGQRQVFKYKPGEGFVYVNISPGRKEDDGCGRAILKYTQKRKEMEKKGTSRRIPKTAVFNAFREKEVDVHLHRPFDFIEWSAITVAEGGKVPYYLTKTFASENVTFGFLDICPLEKKASQYSPEDNIHFLAVKGSLKVVIRKTELMFERLDTFIVPCKEVYSIENIGKTKALLSFCTFRTPFFPHQMSDVDEEDEAT